MKLEDLHGEITKDLPIQKGEYNTESLKTSVLFSKYQKYYTAEKLILFRLRAQMKQLRLEKWTYYSGKADPSVYKAKPFDLKVVREDLNMYIEADDEVIDLQGRITVQEEKVTLLGEVVKHINNRHWQLKNAIDWERFTNGAM